MLRLWHTPANPLCGAVSASQRPGWVPTPKLRSFEGITPTAPLPNQPGIDMKNDSSFPVSPQSAFGQCGASPGTAGWMERSV